MTTTEKRRQKLRRLVNKANVDGILVTNFTNVTYLTGFSGDDSFLLVTRDKDILLSDPRYTEQLQEECPGLELAIRGPGVKMASFLAKVIRESKERLRDRYMRWKKNILEFEASDVQELYLTTLTQMFDPHTTFMNIKEKEKFDQQMNNEFVGIGAVLKDEDGFCTIKELLPGGPAEGSRELEPEDIILKVAQAEGDFVDVRGKKLSKIVDLIKGPKDTLVRLEIKPVKDPSNTKIVRIIREKIKLTANLASATLHEVDHGKSKTLVGVIDLPKFYGSSGNGPKATDDVEELIEELKSRKAEGLILDLRRNGGGYLSEAVNLAGLFISRGPVVQVKSTDGKIRKKFDFNPKLAWDGPLIVLVSRYSASASEIVAGALRNHNRAIVIGQSTFGKGSVQVLYDFKDHSALKLTVAQYLTPGDVSIQSVGITPDIKVEPVNISKERIALFANDHFLREKDLQQHLNQHDALTTQTQTLPSSYHLINVVEPLSEENEEANALDEFRSDFEIELAQSLLSQISAQERPSMLSESDPIINQKRNLAERELTQRLGKLGIDWSDAPAEKPAGAANVSIFLKTTPLNTLQAGDEITLTATLRNLGKTPLYRVYGITESKNPLFDSLEFAFGKVGPGQKKTWENNVKIPNDYYSRADQITLELDDAQHITKNFTTSSVINITSNLKPRFAFHFRIDDEEKGNGDGMLQQGEEAEFIVDVDTRDPKEVIRKMAKKGFLAGIPVTYRGDDYLLISITEKRTKAELDTFAEALQEVVYV